MRSLILLFAAEKMAVLASWALDAARSIVKEILA
jgi:hypothetical protein